MLVSAAMMLHWLGQRHANAHCQLAGERLDAAVTAGYAEGDFLPYEFGGTSGTMEVADRLCRRLAINGESV
jgi:3-isopropylmalate dehydrogenase